MSKEVNLYAWGFRPFTIRDPKVGFSRKAYWAARSGFRKLVHKHNFGDYLSYYLVRKISRQKVDVVEESRKGKLLAIGSILWSVQDGDMIWGAGCRTPEILPSRNHVKCVAVRGPLTCKILQKSGILSNISTPPLYFDPGIFISLLHPELLCVPKRSNCVTIIPHYSDLEHVERWRREGLLCGGVRVVRPFEHPVKVAAKIAESERVISSSLHGIILAEALGVQAVPLKLEGNREDAFKYEDYYEGSGRPLPSFANSLKKALDMEGPGFQTRSHEKLMELLSSFPYYLSPAFS